MRPVERLKAEAQVTVKAAEAAEAAAREAAGELRAAIGAFLKVEGTQGCRGKERGRRVCKGKKASGGPT